MCKVTEVILQNLENPNISFYLLCILVSSWSTARSLFVQKQQAATVRSWYVIPFFFTEEFLGAVALLKEVNICKTVPH